MAQTRWRGGKTGSILMPEGTVSMRFSEIFNEVPNLFSETTPRPYQYGWYQWTTGAPYPIHETLYQYYAGTLEVTINGVPATITEQSPLLKTFSIDENASGWIRVTYSPSADYFNIAEKSTYPKSPLRTRITPPKRIHINELLSAMNTIADRIGTVRNKFSIKEYTGEPVRYSSSEELVINSPVTRRLFQEIGNHIIFLSNYAISSHQIQLSPPETSFTYNSLYVNINTIEQFHDDINALELALDEAGI